MPTARASAPGASRSSTLSSTVYSPEADTSASAMVGVPPAIPPSLPPLAHATTRTRTSAIAAAATTAEVQSFEPSSTSRTSTATPSWERTLSRHPGMDRARLSQAMTTLTVLGAPASGEMAAMLMHHEAGVDRQQPVG